MITVIGKELRCDHGHSGTENLYYQLFGRWPEYDCVEEDARAILKYYLGTLCKSSYVEDFFGIDTRQVCAITCEKCEECRHEAECRYSEKGVEWLREQVEAQLQKLREEFALELKMLYSEWTNPDTLRKYSEFALRTLGETLANRDLRAQFASEEAKNTQLLKELQERQAYCDRLEAENAQLAESKRKMRANFQKFVDICSELGRQNTELAKLLLEQTRDNET